MFTHDANSNSSMTRSGWTANNLHVLPEMIKLAVKHRNVLKSAGGNYFDRRTASIKAWWRVHAMELVEEDPTLTGADLTKRCQAHYNFAHQATPEHRARAMMNDPSAQFPNYFTATPNKPDYNRVARAAYELMPRVIGV